MTVVTDLTPASAGTWLQLGVLVVVGLMAVVGLASRRRLAEIDVKEPTRWAIRFGCTLIAEGTLLGFLLSGPLEFIAAALRHTLSLEFGWAPLILGLGIEIIAVLLLFGAVAEDWERRPLPLTK